MPVILPAHIAAGIVALVFGYLALYAAKGATLHRRAGIIFVYAMVTMSVSGALMDALRTSSVSTNVVAGLVTFYFVTTALLTVRARSTHAQRIDALAMFLGLVAAALAFKSGVALSKSGRAEMGPLFLFGTLGLVAVAGDFRMLLAGGIQGSRRIQRHLWRMCFAMWVAAASFFWGPPRRVPEMLRIPALQAFAVLVPIMAMMYWLWRLRVQRNSRRLHLSTAASEAGAASGKWNTM